MSSVTTNTSVMVDDHARHYVMGAQGDEQGDKTDELMTAVGRLMRRS
jgi:hypothetical protein